MPPTPLIVGYVPNQDASVENNNIIVMGIMNGIVGEENQRVETKLRTERKDGRQNPKWTKNNRILYWSQQNSYIRR